MKFHFSTLQLALAFAALITSFATSARAENVETYRLKVYPSLKRCEPDPQYPGAKRCVESDVASPREITMELKDCNSDNYYGKNCGGVYKAIIENSGEKFTYYALLTRFDETKDFKYILSLRIVKESDGNKTLATNTLYLKDATLPYISTVTYPTQTVLSPGTATQFELAPSFQLGEGVKEGL